MATLQLSTAERTAFFAQALGLELHALQLIKRNPYCSIYQAQTGAARCIIKHYLPAHTQLVAVEAAAVDAYHAIAHADPQLIDARTLAHAPAENLVCISFVSGEPLSDLLRRAARDDNARAGAINAMRILAAVLQRWQATTRQPDAPTDPFFGEYIAYCSARLRAMPVLGHLLFRAMPASGARITDAFYRARIVPSFAHGDCVFRNIHVEGRRIGMIDFANTNPRSHLLNDYYNLRLAFANMLLPRALKTQVWQAFDAALDVHAMPACAHAFYWEYHRRRWLMLKLRARHPREWAEGLRGLLSFARQLPQPPGATA